MDDLDYETDLFAGMVRGRMARGPEYTAAQNIPGIGPTLAAVFVAQIGDITRFASASKLTCWAGLTPKHHESGEERAAPADAAQRASEQRSHRDAWSQGRLVENDGTAEPARGRGNDDRQRRDDEQGVAQTPASTEADDAGLAIIVVFSGVVVGRWLRVRGGPLVPWLPCWTART
jgi:hypothetical protein